MKPIKIFELKKENFLQVFSKQKEYPINGIWRNITNFDPVML